MKTLLRGAAGVLLPLSAAAPAVAQSTEPADPIIVESPLLHPAAGLMGDHMHIGGEAMIGLRLERRGWSGTHQSGTEPVTDAKLLAAG